VRLRWRTTDNAAAHLRIKVTVDGRTVTLRRAPLAGRRTLTFAATAAPFTALIAIADQSGNEVVQARRAR
jgi:hypothetical protein